MRRAKWVEVGLVGAVAAVLAACGGGDGSGVTGTGLYISGTAAVGAPMAGALVQLIDRNGVVAASVTANTSGSFRFEGINEVAYPAPYVLSAYGAVGDTKETLVSVKPDSASGVVNITPITHAIAAKFSRSG